MKVIAKGIVARSTQRSGNYWPSVARLADGRLAAVWSGGRRNHICPFGRLSVAYSADEGRHWSPEAILFDTPLDDRDGGILSWKGKTVVTTFNNTRAFQMECLAKWPDNRPEGEEALIRAYLGTVSDEDERESLGSWLLVGDGERFEKPQKLPITAPHGPIVMTVSSCGASPQETAPANISKKKSFFISFRFFASPEDRSPPLPHRSGTPHTKNSFRPLAGKRPRASHRYFTKRFSAGIGTNSVSPGAFQPQESS